ncbi:MAG TPA: methyl-accepting chemotaxis protein [Ktedonobacteraceae bacterium]
MSEEKQPSRSVPLRLRIRSQSGPLPVARSAGEISVLPPELSANDAPTAPSLPIVNNVELLQSRQVKELIRLGNILRAEQGLGEVLEQVVSSINRCTGFRRAIVHLIEERRDVMTLLAFAGIPEVEQRKLRENPMLVNQMFRFMRPEFQISQSYFIGHEYKHLFSDIVSVGGGPAVNHQPGDWHPEDGLIIPLFSPRQRKVLGFISLDDPADGRVPGEENIEIVELFANQAATAIDNALLFQEREAERVALESAILDLRHDLERVQRGDLRVRVQVSHEKLKLVAEAINVTLGEISSILGTVQLVTQAVDEHAQDVQHLSALLVKDTNQQERQVQHISLAIDEMTAIMQRVTDNATKISTVSVDAMDVNEEGQNQIGRAIDGMRQVREITMQSSRVIKRLGESGQEINETVAEISDLTARMNLLALNAAIEAVRAGDQGQGFVMIAQEIRSLSVHSAEATRRVASRLRTIQHETAAVAESVEQNIQQVVVQSELVSQTGAALEAISVITTQMSDLVEEICSATEGQTQGSRRVAFSIEEITRMTSEINQHMQEMQQSLSHLVELTNLLRTRVSVFRTVDEA